MPLTENWQFPCFKPVKTSFLVFKPVSLLLCHFYLNFILFVHSCHVNFNLNQCSVFTKCYFSLKRVQIVKITPHQIPTTPPKISFIAKFLTAFTWGNFHLPWTLFAKNLDFPFALEKDFLEKITKVKITFVYLSCTIILKKPLQQIMKQ